MPHKKKRKSSATPSEQEVKKPAVAFTPRSISFKRYEFTSVDNTCELLMEELERNPNAKKYPNVTFIMGNPPVDVTVIKPQLLALRSPIFKELLFGTVEYELNIVERISAESDLRKVTDIRTTIVCEEISPTAFQHLVNYAYENTTKKIPFSELPSLALAAKRFGFVELFMACLRSLRGKPLFTCYEKFCVDEEWTDFSTDLWTFICRMGYVTLQSKDFLNISQQNLCRLLESNDLNCNEHDVYISTMRWAVNKCTQNNQDATNEANIQDVLGLARKLVRYPILTPDEYYATAGTDYVENSGMLLCHELNEIYMFKATKLPNYLKPPLSCVTRNIDDTWFMG